VIVKQVLGLSPEEPVTSRILEDFLAFMKGLVSFPLYIPGTPYAKAVQVNHPDYMMPLIISAHYAYIN
jgi:cytochrome P450 family 724 subfamily B polypeptide 1